MTRNSLSLTIALLCGTVVPLVSDVAAAQDTTQAQTLQQSTPPPQDPQQVPPAQPVSPPPPTEAVPPVAPAEPPLPPAAPPPPMPQPPAEPMPPAPPVPPEAPAEPMPPAPPAPSTMPAQPPQSSTTLPDSSAATSAPVTVNQLPADSVSPNYRLDFGALDRNGDGSIGRDEARASGNEDLVREFHVVDANHNGRLTREELKGWLD